MKSKQGRLLLWLNFIGSMRVAIFALLLTAVISFIGSIIPQNMPEVQYLDRYGIYGWEIIRVLGLNQVYNTLWFILGMGFLVLSTSICVIRNWSYFWRGFRAFEFKQTAKSLELMPYSFSASFDQKSKPNLALVSQACTDFLRQEGFKLRLRQPSDPAKGVLISAKKGSFNRLGYIFTHVAVIVLCIGGLLDSQAWVRAKIFWHDLSPIAHGVQFVSQVPAKSILPSDNFSFRANMSVAEGSFAKVAVLTVGDEQYLQRLPFELGLRDFKIINYDLNNMPKRFISTVDIKDVITGEVSQHVIEVNHPLRINNINIYQSGFADGGSTLDLRAYAVSEYISESSESAAAFNTTVTVGEAFNYSANGRDYKLVVNELRPSNIQIIDSKPTEVGASWTYTITDDSNQSQQFTSYMDTIRKDNVAVFGLGVGNKYLYIPASYNSMAEFMALNQLFKDARQRDIAIKLVAQNVQDSIFTPEALETLSSIAINTYLASGWQGLHNYVDNLRLPDGMLLPEASRETVRTVLLNQIMQTVLVLRHQVRANLGLGPLRLDSIEQKEEQLQWMDYALRAMAVLDQYPAHFVFSLERYEHKLASLFQVSRAPGESLVVIGAIFLLLGIVLMLYVPYVRLWVWIEASETGSHTALFAITTSHKNLSFSQYVEGLKQRFQQFV